MAANIDANKRFIVFLLLQFLLLLNFNCVKCKSKLKNGYKNVLFIVADDLGIV